MTGEACRRVHENAKPSAFEGCTARAQRCVDVWVVVYIYMYMCMRVPKPKAKHEACAHLFRMTHEKLNPPFPTNCICLASQQDRPAPQAH